MFLKTYALLIQDVWCDDVETWIQENFVIKPTRFYKLASIALVFLNQYYIFQIFSSEVFYFHQVSSSKRFKEAKIFLYLNKSDTATNTVSQI